MTFKKILKTVMLTGLAAVTLSLSSCGSEHEDNPKRDGRCALPFDTIYCTEMGYILESREEPAGQYSVCIFPDNSECGTADFYWGKCKPELSYCKQNGYELKDPTDDVGWREGAICTDAQGNEIGSVYDLLHLEKYCR